MKRIALAFAAVAALSATIPAKASVVITDYAIAGPVTGTFSLSFDTGTSLYSLLALDLPVGSTLFDTTNAGLVQVGQDVTIGGNPSGPSVLAPSGDDFKFHFEPGGTFNSFFDVFFEIRPGDSAFGTITPMPELSTWAMMILGFTGIGLAVRRRISARIEQGIG